MDYRRTYITVYAECYTDGSMKPLEIEWNGKRYSVDRVVEVKRRAAVNAGGAGMRYTCMINGKERYLFYDDRMWFVEEKINAS